MGGFGNQRASFQDPLVVYIQFMIEVLTNARFEPTPGEAQTDYKEHVMAVYYTRSAQSLAIELSKLIYTHESWFQDEKILTKVEKLPTVESLQDLELTFDILCPEEISIRIHYKAPIHNQAGPTGSGQITPVPEPTVQCEPAPSSEPTVKRRLSVPGLSSMVCWATTCTRRPTPPESNLPKPTVPEIPRQQSSRVRGQKKTTNDDV